MQFLPLVFAFLEVLIAMELKKISMKQEQNNAFSNFWCTEHNKILMNWLSKSFWNDFYPKANLYILFSVELPWNIMHSCQYIHKEYHWKTSSLHWHLGINSHVWRNNIYDN